MENMNLTCNCSVKLTFARKPWNADIITTVILSVALCSNIHNNKNSIQMVCQDVYLGSKVIFQKKLGKLCPHHAEIVYTYLVLRKRYCIYIYIPISIVQHT